MLIAHWLTKYVLPTISSCRRGESPSCQTTSDVGPSKSETPGRTHHPVCVAPGLLTYGGDEGCVEGVVREAEQHTGLPHARVSDQKQLEQQVVRLLRH